MQHQIASRGSAICIDDEALRMIGQPARIGSVVIIEKPHAPMILRPALTVTGLHHQTLTPQAQPPLRARPYPPLPGAAIEGQIARGGIPSYAASSLCSLIEHALNLAAVNVQFAGNCTLADAGLVH